MIQIDAAARLPPEAAHGIKTAFHEVAALATIVVSVFIVALVLFYMWAELEGRGALVPLLLAFRRTASLCGFFALSHIFDGPLR